MLDLMIGLPPITRGTEMTSGDVIAFWVTVSIIAAVVLVTAVILAIAAKRSVGRQARIQEAERHYEVISQPQSSEPLPVHTSEEEKILVPR